MICFITLVGFSKPLRVQGAFISDSEVELLLDFIKKQGEPEINEEIISFTEETTSSENSSNSESTEFTDELLQAAINMVFGAQGKLSSFNVTT